MDKNTLTGLLLMAGVIFGFMWLNKPSEEEIRARQEAQAQAQLEQQQAEKKPLQAEVITPEEAAQVVPGVKKFGTADPEHPEVYTLRNSTLDLAYNTADSTLTGTVKVGEKKIDVNKIMANDLLEYTPELADNACKTLRGSIAELNKYKSFAQFLDGEDKLTVIENDQVRVTFGSRGGRVSSVVLKDYKSEVTEPATDIELFNDSTSTFNFTLVTADQRINTSELNFRTEEVTDTSLVMALPLGEGVDWKIRYTVVPDIYVVKMDVIQRGVAEVIPPRTTTVSIDWTQRMMRNEKGRTFEERNSMLSYKMADESPSDLNNNKNDDESITGHIKWVAFKNQFFSSVLIARKHMTSAELQSTVVKDSKTFLKDMSMQAVMPYNTADGEVMGFDWYFGPNSYPLLKSLNDELASGDESLDLNRLVPLGYWWYSWINRWVIIPVFNFLGKYISNYGLIIFLLTIFIKIVIFPFTYKSFVSQAKMRVLAPEIKAINEKYPGQENAMKRQQETMALYSRAGASPMSGCLPMLLQMPILIAMFSFFPSAIELRGQSFLWAHDLSAPDSILTLPFSIPFYGNHVSLFCLLMTIVNIVYTKITMASNPGNDQMPGMKWMMYLMPVMFLFFFNDYASALSYYYLLSLLITIIQTYVIRHFIIKEDKVRAQMAENAKKPKKKSGFMARLEAAQKQQEAMMRQQAKQNAKKRK